MEIKFLCTRGTSHSASMPEALEVARNVRWDMQMNQTVLQRRAKKPQMPPESSLLHNPGSCLSAEMRWERCIDLASQRGFCVPAERLDSAAPVASDLYGFWGRARERNKRKTQKSQSVVHLGKKVPSWLLRYESYSHHTTSAQSVQRTILIVFPVTCKAEKCLTNSDCSAKRSTADNHLGWLHKCSRMKHLILLIPELNINCKP